MNATLAGMLSDDDYHADSSVELQPDSASSEDKEYKNKKVELKTENFKNVIWKNKTDHEYFQFGSDPEAEDWQCPTEAQTEKLVRQ